MASWFDKEWVKEAYDYTFPLAKPYSSTCVVAAPLIIYPLANLMWVLTFNS